MPDPQSRPPDRRKLDPGLDLLANWLDTAFRIPGTSWRFGLDPLLGLFPGLGDTVSSLAGLYILYSAMRYQVPRSTLLRMGANLALDYCVGAVPVVGDAFDVYWKSNRRNVLLLQEHLEITPAQPRKNTWRDWLWLAGLVLALVALLISSVWIAFLVLRFAFERLASL